MRIETRLSLQDRLLSAALAAALAFAGLFWSGIARAEDIDIYSLPNVEGLRPNVLIILDSSANWSASLKNLPKCDAPGAKVDSKHEDTKFGKEKCALYKVIYSMSVADLSQFNFALMLFNESPEDSGYPRKAFIRVSSDADKTTLLNLIAGLDRDNDKTNNASSATSFYEAYQWFTGGAVYQRQQDRNQARRGRIHRRQQDAVPVSRGSAARATTSSTSPTARLRTTTTARSRC